MALVTAINARPPRPPDRGGRGFVFGEGEGSDRVAEIVGPHAAELGRTVSVAVAAGYAVMVSPTSDGGAVGLHIWLGQRKDQTYSNTPEAFASALQRLHDAAEAKLMGHALHDPKLAQKAPAGT